MTTRIKQRPQPEGRRISATLARRQLMDLLDAVARGESITITRYGKAKALLTQPEQMDAKADAEASVAA